MRGWRGGEGRTERRIEEGGRGGDGEGGDNGEDLDDAVDDGEDEEGDLNGEEDGRLGLAAPLGDEVQLIGNDHDGERRVDQLPDDEEHELDEEEDHAIADEEKGKGERRDDLGVDAKDADGGDGRGPEGSGAQDEHEAEVGKPEAQVADQGVL